MDIIAHELGLDPLELRLRNAMVSGEISPLGTRWWNVPTRQVLLAAAEAAGWGADKEPNVGRGLALYCRPNSAWPSNIKVTIGPDCQVAVHTGVVDTGTGSHTVLQQIAAEELQVPLSMVSVVASDTDASPYDAGVAASRVSYSAGLATQSAAQELRQALVNLAARLMGCAPVRVELGEGRLATDDGRAITLAELMARAAELGEAPLSGSGNFSAYLEAEFSEYAALAAQIAEVEVDAETGQVKLRKVVTAHEVGTIINPLGHQGQIDGNIVGGVGHALIEHLVIEDGSVTTANLGDYKMATAADIPELSTVLIEDKAGGPLPYGAKEIAERVHVAIPPAVANAVFDAVGVRLTELPITSEKVHKALSPRKS